MLPETYVEATEVPEILDDDPAECMTVSRSYYFPRLFAREIGVRKIGRWQQSVAEEN
jgi:hypothetical protein